MRIRQITGTSQRKNAGTPEAVLLHVDGEELHLMGEGICMGDVLREMEKLRDEGCEDVGMPIQPPEGWEP